MSNKSMGLTAGMFKKVLLPQRIKSDVIDGAISSSLVLVPLYVVYASAEYLPESFHRLSIIGIPVAIIYVIFRDSIARGTSLGKRALGLVVVDLRTGQPSDGKRVLARNVIDIIPVVDLVDFLLTCLDRKGQKIMDKVLGTQVTERRVLVVAQLTPNSSAGVDNPAPHLN